MNMATIRRGPSLSELVDTGNSAPVLIVQPLKFIHMSLIPSRHVLVRRGVIQP